MSYALWDFLSSLPGIVIMVLAVHWLTGYRRTWHIPLHIVLIAAATFLRIFEIAFPPGAFWALGMVVFLLPAALLCRGKIYWRILCAGLVLLANMIADYLAYMAVLVFFPDVIYTPDAMPVSALLFGKGMCAVLLILLCMLMLALKPSAKNAARPEITRKFFLFPASQVFVLGILYGYITWYNAGPPLIAFGVASFVFCVAADVGMFLALRELGRKYEVELENADLQSRLGAQISYYEQIKSGMEQMRRIRHDFGNQLQTVYTLLESGDTIEARTQLDALNTALRQTGVARFTDNPVADAVLRDKARLCTERGIPLHVKAELPTSLPIDGVDLCSVLSNLLDNAVNACEKEDKTERYIDLSTAVRSGYLIVKTKNNAAMGVPAQSNKAASISEASPCHGLGLQILRSIAQRYNGKLETSFEDGVFEATIWLALEAE